MILFILWVALSFLVAMMGSNKKIGFGMSLVLSLLFSPLVGFIIVMVSPEEEDSATINARNQIQNKQLEVLNNLSEKSSTIVPETKSISDEIEKLNKLKSDGIITEDEFQTLKNKLIQ